MLSIAWKDLLILFKDRNAMVGAFLLPIVFIVVFLGVIGPEQRRRRGERRGGAEGGPRGRQQRPGRGLGAGPDGETWRSTPTSPSRQTPTTEARAAAGRAADRALTSSSRPASAPTSPPAPGDPAARQQQPRPRHERGRPHGRRPASPATMSLEQQIVASLERLGEMQRANPSFDPATSAELAVPIARAPVRGIAATGRSSSSCRVAAGLARPGRSRSRSPASSSACPGSPSCSSS